MIPLEYYLQQDVVALAKDLIGTYLFTKTNDIITGGMIIETEAYAGITDRASHAYDNRRTKRTEAMYQRGGIAYVYLCYGMYPLFNIVTNTKDVPHAVLIRAIDPLIGIPDMEKRRKKRKPLANGPGMLTQALNLTLKNNRQSLTSNTLWLEPKKELIRDNQIEATPRIGIAYAKEDALLPYRFRLKTSLNESQLEKISTY